MIDPTTMTSEGILNLTAVVLKLECGTEFESGLDKARTRLYASGVYVSTALRQYTWTIDPQNVFVIKEVNGETANEALHNLVKPRAIMLVKNSIFELSIFDLTANLH